MKKRTKIAVVGCGGFCRGNHIPNLLANPKVEVTALCDLKPEGLERFGVPRITTDMEEVFADQEVEGVVCATKPDARRGVMELAKKYGKPLFVEKPLCWGEEQTLETLELMRGFKKTFFVGFNRQFSPLMQDALELFKRYCTRGNTTILYRIVGEARLWPKSHYAAVVDKKESTIVHEITHIFQLFKFLTGEFPLSVNTSGGGNMDNIITLEYPRDITAVIIAGDNGTAGFPKEYLEIDGNYTTIAGYDFAELEATCADGRFYRKRYAYTVEGKKYRTSRAVMEGKLRAFRNAVTQEQMAYGYYYDKQVCVDKGHANEMEAFRRCIAEHLPSPVDLFSGAAANLLAYRALQSFEEGRRIPLDFKSLLKK